MSHICAPAPIECTLMRGYCSTCDRKSWAVSFYYEWYGPSATCLRCGESWNEEGMEERPFCRGWRQMSIDGAKSLWRRYRAAGVPLTWRYEP